MTIEERIIELKKEGKTFEGLDNCPGCESENSWCNEHQQIQKILSEEGFNTIDINFALPEE